MRDKKTELTARFRKRCHTRKKKYRSIPAKRCVRAEAEIGTEANDKQAYVYTVLRVYTCIYTHTFGYPQRQKHHHTTHHVRRKFSLWFHSFVVIRCGTRCEEGREQAIHNTAQDQTLRILYMESVEPEGNDIILTVFLEILSVLHFEGNFLSEHDGYTTTNGHKHAERHTPRR